MATKDLNILGQKVSTPANKKDIAVVSGFNSYVQKVENICKLQENEIPSDMGIGVDYYNFIFNPVANKYLTQSGISRSIKAAIPEFTSVDADIIYYSDNTITMDVEFTLSIQSKIQNSKCRIEVPLT
jgi:hypothetical protein